MQRHFPIFFKNIPDETLRWEKLFICENIQVTAEVELVNRFQLKQYLFCLTTTYLQSVPFKVDELNQFSYSQDQDRYRWKEIMLWVHETTLTTKSEAATC